MTRDPNDKRPLSRAELGDIRQGCQEIMEDALSISRVSAKLLLMLMDASPCDEATTTASPDPDRERPTIAPPRARK
jgi:hypothetical protein